MGKSVYVRFRVQERIWPTPIQEIIVENDGIHENEDGWLVGHLNNKKTSEKCKTRAKLMREKWNDNNNNNNNKEKKKNNEQANKHSKRYSTRIYWKQHISRIHFVILSHELLAGTTLLFEISIFFFFSQMKNNPNNLLSTGRREIEKKM